MRTSLALVVGLVSLTACHSGSDSEPVAPLRPQVENLGVAVESVLGGGDLRLVIASEASQGADLDGDGDLEDAVVQLLDLGTGRLTNTAMAAVLPYRRGEPLRGDVVPPPAFGCTDSLAVFQADELSSGRDLDGDGTPGEIASWIYDRARDELRPLPFAHAGLELEGEVAALLETLPGGGAALHVYDARDGSLETLAEEPSSLMAVGERIVAFSVSEQGAFDLDGDGDTSDPFVLQLYDVDSGLTRNAMFAARLPVRVRQGFAAFEVSEAERHQDLDGDGDTLDHVLVAVEARTGPVRIPGLSEVIIADFLQSDPELFLLEARESGLDRNGDGDAADLIALAYDPVSDRLVDTGLASSLPLMRSGRWLGLSVLERDQGGMDLDGDGSSDGFVLHAFDLQTGRARNLRTFGVFLAALDHGFLGLRPASGSPSELIAWDARSLSLRALGADARSALGIAGDVALLIVREHEDRNGDGDANDFVLELCDGRALHGLGLAWSGGDCHLGPDGRGVLVVSETAQGVDLNGDGDLLDQVLHTLDLGL